MNVDNCAPMGDPKRTRGNVGDLSDLVDAGEAEEIVALDILDFFPGEMADQVLHNWLSRLSRGGKITVGVVDVREVARGLLDGRLTLDDAQELLHGRQTAEWDYRKSVFTLSHLVEVLTNLGLKVLKKRVENYRAIVTAERQ